MSNIYLHRKTSFSFWFSLISVCETKFLLFSFFYNNNKFAGNQKIIIIFKIVYACLKSVLVLDFWQIYREANQVDFLGLFIHLRIHSQHTHMHPLTRTQHATFCLAILTYLFICFFSLFFCFRFRTIWLTTQQQLQ